MAMRIVAMLGMLISGVIVLSGFGYMTSAKSAFHEQTAMTIVGIGCVCFVLCLIYEAIAEIYCLLAERLKNIEKEVDTNGILLQQQNNLLDQLTDAEE